jgi:hypothetical protein
MIPEKSSPFPASHAHGESSIATGRRTDIKSYSRQSHPRDPDPTICQKLKDLPHMRIAFLSLILAVVLQFPVAAQTLLTAAPVAPTATSINKAVLDALREDDLSKAFEALEAFVPKTVNTEDPFLAQLSAASGGLHRALTQLGTDEQYDLLRKWSIPKDTSKPVRVLTSLVPEIAPPMEFARALGQRPKKESFAIAKVGEIVGLFCSAWTMVVAADDAGSLRQLITELEALAAKKTVNADFVLTLAKIRDTRTTDAELIAKLTTRVAPQGDNGELTALHDAVLVSAAMTRTGLGPVCEQ